MDLLDSILNGMEKPPTVAKKAPILDKEKREKFEKIKKARLDAIKTEKQTIEKFRLYMQQKVKKFMESNTTKDLSTQKLQLKPMTKIFRSIVYETCDDYSDKIVVHSFGTEEIDRHCILWKVGYEPNEDELHALKVGVEYKPKSNNQEDESSSDQDEPSTSKTIDGKDKFREKYDKIIGSNSFGVEAARIAEPAKQYGCVPIENKKDLRSVEQVLDGIRKHKKAKLDKTEEQKETDQ